MNEFFASLYEAFYYSDPSQFSGYVYDFGLYVPIGLIMVISSLILPIVFFYIINHPRFNKWYHWLIILGATLAINFLYAFFTLKTEFELQGFEYGQEYFSFGLVNSFLAMCSYFIFSISIRRWSRNSSCFIYKPIL